MNVIRRMATQLVSLKDVERLSPTVIRILGGNPNKITIPLSSKRRILSDAVPNVQFTLQGTNTYLIGTGPQRLLIDTGEGKPIWPENLASVLSSEKATIRDTILTHWHHDHVDGVTDLLKLCPESKVYKNEPDKGMLSCEDGQRFEVEGATLRAFKCPGHTTDHVALVLEEEGAMFTGDNVLGHGTAVFEDLAAYLNSLEQMRHQFTGRAYPAHGAIIEDGRARIVEYIKHRQQREDEIIRVLKYGTLHPPEIPDGNIQSKAWTSMELVKVIYHEVPVNLHEPAEKGVIMVLKKLRGEGKLSQGQDGRWMLNERSAL